METLIELGIDILPPTKMVARPFKVVDTNNEIYFAAEVSEFRDFWLESVGVVFAVTETELKDILQKKYRCEYFTERTLKNFVIWYKNLTNRQISVSEMNKVINKFVNND